jgi:hypothetical protein
MPQGQIERRGERRFLIHWWSHWPEVAHERMAQALGEVEALRLELRIGPLAEGGIGSRVEPRSAIVGQRGAPLPRNGGQSSC